LPVGGDEVGRETPGRVENTRPEASVLGSQGRSYAQSHPWITFTFDLYRLTSLDFVRLGEAMSKRHHISGVPLPPGVADQLHQIYLVKGIHATTQIEGNSLSEDQVRARVEGDLELPASQEYLGQEVDNILAIPRLTPDLAALYAGKTRKTLTRDVNCLQDAGLLAAKARPSGPTWSRCLPSSRSASKLRPGTKKLWPR
jgi:hypothetical protein